MTTIGHNSSSVIDMGREAYARIKANGKMLREDWRAVGEALLVGKLTNHSTKAFGKWVEENGFAEIDKTTRGAAIWLAENWSEVSTAYLTHHNPCHIKAAHRKESAPLPIKSDELTKLRGLISHYERDGNEAEIAERKLEKIATEKRMTITQLVEKAKAKIADLEETEELALLRHTI